MKKELKELIKKNKYTEDQILTILSAYKPPEADKEEEDLDFSIEEEAEEKPAETPKKIIKKTTKKTLKDTLKEIMAEIAEDSKKPSQAPIKPEEKETPIKKTEPKATRKEEYTNELYWT